MKSIYAYRSKVNVALFFLLILTQWSCKKSFLDAKPNLALVVPNAVADYQAILDNNIANNLFNYNQPSLPEIGAGDFYLQYTSWQTLINAQERNAYLWSPDIYAGQISFDWNNAYQRILNENVVLNGIVNISYNSSNEASWNNVKGTGLFYRAYDFLCLAEEFAKAYDASSANTDLGIPLRTSSDINVKSVRATVLETYNQIINDLLIAKSLLPASVVYPDRPGKGAVYGLLSRVYLDQSNYAKALAYADSSLQLNNKLIDFNTLSKTSSNPITYFNPEVIYNHFLSSYSSFNNSSPDLIVDSTLYNSYSANDLRKVIYFKTVSGLITRKASYSGNTYLFGGLATDEMYLTRAECYARLNNVSSAMQDLNALLVTRWASGTFTPYTASNSTDALNEILLERRKELIFRGRRWADLKRLNKDPNTAVTLARIFNGQTYTLLPNSDLYVFPIPTDEIQLSGLQQNPR